MRVQFVRTDDDSKRLNFSELKARIALAVLDVQAGDSLNGELAAGDFLLRAGGALDEIARRPQVWAKAARAARASVELTEQFARFSFDDMYELFDQLCEFTFDAVGLVRWQTCGEPAQA